MTCELVERINSRSLMLLYDIGNSFRAEQLPCPDRFAKASIVDESKRIREKVKYFHFKDYRKTESGFRHAIFGEGDVGYKNLYRHIKRDRGNKIVIGMI